MATKLGKYYICDRCGVTSFFETRFDKFEEATDWNTVYPKATHDIGSSKLLCPECSKKYNKLMQEFFDDLRDFNRRG